MAIDPLTIAVLTLTVAVIALLFGPGIGFRFVNRVRGYLRTRADRKHEISEYLRHSAMFLEGLPHFISQTWAWGPSVPNYGAGGSFPPETPSVAARMPSVCAAVRDAQALYMRHSKTQGRPYATLAGTLEHLKAIECKFWEAVEAFARSRWPLRWRVKLRHLRALQIPTSEHDRIRSFKIPEPAESKAAPAPGDALPLPDKPSVAVLPFSNMSGDSEQGYFADGIAEDIITGLSRLRWLFVIARNSSFTYTGRNVDVRQVGRELGVRYILEGSVRKGGNRIRITGQLVEAETGNHLWAERYDRALDDVFAIQDEITESVIGCIQPELYAAEHDRLKRKPPQSLDAWESFVRGMFLYSQHSDASTKEALDVLDRAVELDRGYASAHGLRAVCLAWRAIQGWENRDTAFAEAAEGADRAVACDPGEPWAYLAHGFIALAKRRNSEAVGAFGRAIDASPNFAYAHGLLGCAHALGGRSDQAIECIDRGVRLSPRDSFGDEYQLYYAFAHFQAGRYAEAASAAHLAIQQRPGHPVLYIMAAASYGLAGETDKATRAITQLTDLVPNISATDLEENFIYCQREDRSRLAMGLRAGGLPR